MSQETPSRDLPSDPRNEDDFDTWEYGTEPLPGDDTWTNLPTQTDVYDEETAAEMTDLYEEILNSQEADLNTTLWDIWEAGKKR